MNKNDALSKLQAVYNEMIAMTDEEFFDYMSLKSESFRELVNMSTPLVQIEKNNLEDFFGNEEIKTSLVDKKINIDLSKTESLSLGEEIWNLAA